MLIENDANDASAAIGFETASIEKLRKVVLVWLISLRGLSLLSVLLHMAPRNIHPQHVATDGSILLQRCSGSREGERGKVGMGQSFILGGGMTGLAAGYLSGLPVYEANREPGGICCSYYVRPDSTERLHQAPSDDEAYRFEIGGGHWIFGGDPAILQFISGITGVESYLRRSSVFFPDKGLYVPYPLQNHLRFLSPELSSKALIEMSRQPVPFQTMKDWLHQSFGPTLCELFFDRFHALYTAGLYDRIAPQDAYKSPVDLSLVIQGAFGGVEPIGYNTSFVYPTGGLDVLARRMSGKCDIRYEKRAIRVDPLSRLVEFEDGSILKYERLISTLPLSTIMKMTGLSVSSPPDPYSSVLVLNIGAGRGPRCPDDHWIYLSSSASGFHRVRILQCGQPTISTGIRASITWPCEPLRRAGLFT